MVACTDLLDRSACGLGFDSKDVFHTWVVDGAGADSIDADVVLTEFHCQCFGEANNGPFGDSVGRAHGIAKESGGGGDVDDAATALRFEVRNDTAAGRIGC